MLRIISNGRYTLGLLLFGNSSNPADEVKNLTPTEQNADMSILKAETGFDRLKRMFEADEFGNVSKEIQSILTVSAMSIFIGALYGGTMHSRVAYTEFIRNNQATSFTDHFEAKKKLQDKVMLGFGKGAFKWGWRLSWFCTCFMGVATSISVYRGKNGIIEYGVAGLVAGSTYKFNLGPRGWIVGGCLGSVLGFVAGGVTYGILKAAGMTMDDARYWQHHWQEKRIQYFEDGVKNYMEKNEEPLLRQHNQVVGEAGKHLENIK